MTHFHPRKLVCTLLFAVCMITVTPPVSAKDRFRIPPPPPPEKVVRDIRGFIHRLAHGVRDASKQTWGAIRERFDEDEPPPRKPRTTQRPKTDQTPPPESESFAQSKEPVPYPHDDADPFEGPRPPGIPSEGSQQGSVAPPDAPKYGAADEPKPVDPSSRKPPFMAPDAEAQAPATQPTPPAPSSSASSAPNVTAPPVDGNIQFARPVPGKRGLVYPPGAKESEEYMVDVGDFPTGQIVRDPRTGKLFRVP